MFQRGLFCTEFSLLVLRTFSKQPKLTTFVADTLLWLSWQLTEILGLGYLSSQPGCFTKALDTVAHKLNSKKSELYFGRCLKWGQAGTRCSSNPAVSKYRYNAIRPLKGWLSGSASAPHLGCQSPIPPNQIILLSDSYSN